MKKKAGRPQIATELQRNKYLQVRISDDEREIFHESARKSGLELSQWVRTTLLMAARSGGRESKQ